MLFLLFFFFFKQKTAYEWRISDWSSDVCSSDLIPFDRLFLSQSNVRRVKAGVSVEALADDIDRRTLLQSLNVRPERDASGKETGRYEIPAGGRRYRALELLVKRKRLANDAPLPSGVRAADSDIPAEAHHFAERKRGVTGKGGYERCE